MTAFIQANAQEKEDWGTDSLECRKCLSLYAEPMKQKNYAEAATHWRCVINICPKYKESIYINGAIIYRSFIGEERRTSSGRLRLQKINSTIAIAAKIDKIPK